MSWQSTLAVELKKAFMSASSSDWRDTTKSKPGQAGDSLPSLASSMPLLSKRRLRQYFYILAVRQDRLCYGATPREGVTMAKQSRQAEDSSPA
jgi:hypothetical protein